MTFNSYTFAIFFLLVLVLDRWLASWTIRKFALLVLSYLFYCAWNPPFVALLWLSTIVDWHLARWIHRQAHPVTRKLLLIASLATNLGLLGFFKYGNFVLRNLNGLFSWFEWASLPSHLDIVLPVGISFYTFQTLSYTLDVYRRKLTPGKSFLDYALYVTFFPQLVAGPIVRASDFLPQCEAPRRASSAQLGWGLVLLVVGLFNKVVVADTLMAPIADHVFGAASVSSFADAWLGAFAFSVQIFCDFAGYSTCAIGVALCLGFALPDNFRFPYAAIGFSDFWSRWHISLSTWLRDYLYIPLGGNRGGPLRTYYNLMLTMLLGGLWHGASWLFVCWGGLHGLFLVAERLLGKVLARHRLTERRGVAGALMLLTFLLVTIAWVFFRARSLSAAGQMLLAMAGGPLAPELLAWSQAGLVIMVTAAVLAMHAAMRNRTLEELCGRTPIRLNALLLAVLLMLTLFCMGKDGASAFIYFQF